MGDKNLSIFIQKQDHPQCPRDHSPSIRKDQVPSQPAARLFAHRDSWYLKPYELVKWIGLLAPVLRESYFAQGSTWLGSHLDYTPQVEARAARAIFEYYFDTKTSLGEMGYLCLALGLGDGDAECAGIARDVLSEFLTDNTRLAQSRLAKTMNRLFREGCVKAGRWSKQLTDVSRVSPEHAKIVCGLLQNVLSGEEQEAPKDVHYLLELLIELIAETGMELSSETKAYLKKLKASGKTGTLAKKLLG